MTYAIEGLFLSVQLYSSCDNSRYGINAEVFPVFVTCSSLQEGISDLSIHTLI